MEFDADTWEEEIKKKNPLLYAAFASLDHAIVHYRKRAEEDERRFALEALDESLELIMKAGSFRDDKRYRDLQFPTLVLNLARMHPDLTKRDRNASNQVHRERDRCHHEGKPADLKTTHTHENLLN
jgi:hypothetical protein